MKKKTTRSSTEQNKWSLPKWGTPIVERWFSDCEGEALHLSHKQAERMVIENAKIGEPIITPRRQFEIIVQDFQSMINILSGKLNREDIFFRGLFGYSRSKLKEEK